MAYRRTKRVFVWIGLIPVLLVVGGMWRRAQYRELVRMADHTRDVQVAIQDLLISLNDAETGRRGVIAMGDAKYKELVESASAKSAETVRRLKDLTADNPDQQANARALQQLVTERMDLLKQTAEFGGRDAAFEQEKRVGLAASTQLGKLAREMMAEESRLFDLRKRSTAIVDWEASALLIASSISTILLLLWAYRIVRQYADERDRAEWAVRQANQELNAKIEQLDQLNRKLEERVKERTVDLERSNQDLQQFAFVASHDLQEPLRMVSSYLGLLSKSCQGKLDGDAEKYIGFAIDGAARMQTLIRDLLAYAQVSTQAPILTKTKLSDVVGQARYALLASIRETNAEITIDPLPELEVDPLKMSLVFQNLLSNAIKFRQPGGVPNIHIQARKEGAEWHISVQDSGIGFDPKYAKKIFGAFQRLHGKAEYPGTGIGLAICSRIIDGHGGSMWAEAHPGSGATFHFTLPDLSDSAPEENGSARTGAASGPFGAHDAETRAQVRGSSA